MKSVIVIGGGPGGYVAAIRAAQLGASVTLIEKQYLGGTCLNVGCIPTKCLLHSAELLEELKNRGGELGIKASGVEVDFPQVMAHKNTVSGQLTMGIGALLRMNRVAVIDGEAAFTAPHTVLIRKKDGSETEMSADAFIIATGSVNAVPPIPGVKDNPCCIDSTGALSLETLPKSLAVIGGGVIGTELACAYASFGTKVTILEAMDHMLPMLDSDITRVGMAHLGRMGVEIQLSCRVESVESEGIGALVHCTTGEGGSLTVEAEKVLVAVGRRANTASLGLDAAQIANDRGRILVNDRMQTNIPGVYAIGDCVLGYPQLAHTASAMGETAAENIMGADVAFDAKTNPVCVYMQPEAASVGYTEAACRELGLQYKVGKFPMAANGKALIANGGEGIVKILADAETERILGVHIIGPRATDLIAEGALAIGKQLELRDLISTIHSHPTVSEAVREAALHAQKRAIHTRNPR